MIAAWRLVRRRHAAEAFSGEGARLYGGRWSSRGRRAIYLSEHLSLAALEILVHVHEPALLASYQAFRVEFDEAAVEGLPAGALPADWNGSPAPRELRTLGDRWLDRAARPVLRVPSAVIPIESNFLVNPAHPGFVTLRIGTPQAFDFDPRLR